MSKLQLNGILTYNTDSGLLVSNKAEILQDLVSIAKTSYGETFVVEPGTEFYTFLDLLSTTLAETAGSTKQVFDAFSFITASGVGLDNIVSLAGTIRRENETDAELRLRYFKELYKPAVATVNGLTAKLYAYEFSDENITTEGLISEVRVEENTNSAASSVQIKGSTVSFSAHSIGVVLLFNSKYADLLSNTTLIQEINSVVKDYKSLGCKIMTESGNNYYTAENVTVNFKIAYTTQASVEIRNTIEQNVKKYVTSYVQGLTLGQDILYSGIYAQVYKAYLDLGINDYVFDVTSIQYAKGSGSYTNMTAGSAISIDIGQKATTDTITFNV